MTARQLDVFSNDQAVGRLSEDNDLWTFDYAATWLAWRKNFDLSPALPRGQGTLRDGASQRPVQWYFDNLLPEEALRDTLAREAQLPAEDAFGLLAYFGAESAGSLVLRDPDHRADAERGLRPLALVELSQRIAKLPRQSLTLGAAKRMSMAGAQHKLLVVLDDAGALFEPLAGTPSSHILKPNHPGVGYPASVMNEFFSMRLAKAVGLPAPAVQRRYTPEPVYIVERFDRLHSTEVEVSRRHSIDTCQLLNRPRAFKYAGAGLDALVQALGHCRARAVTRLQLYRWLVFNLLIGNGDNHLKNLSFLVDAQGIALAPAYDLLSTAVYDTRAMADEAARWPECPLALPIGNARSFAQVSRQHVIDAGLALGLGAAAALRELDRLVKAVRAETGRLLATIEAEIHAEVAACPDPGAAALHTAGELRLLRAIQYIVVAEMTRRLG